MTPGAAAVDTAAAAWVDPTARLFGAVTVEVGASVWPYAVIRAESQRVVVGPYANVQDFAMIHVTLEAPTVVGAHCSVAHHATLHGCRLGDNVLVGIAATVADGAVVGENSIVAGNAYVREGTVIPPNSVVAGTPAKVIRDRNCFVETRFNAWLYHVNALAYAHGEHRAWHGEAFEASAREARARIEKEYAARYG